MRTNSSLPNIMFRYYCLLGLSLILGAGLLHAQAIQTGVISGYVVDKDSNPIAGARITVRLDSIISQTVSTITDGEGGFRIPGLPPGIYLVDVEAQDYFQDKSSLVNLRVGKVETITIVMYESQVLTRAPDSPNGPMVFLSTIGINESLDKDILQHLPIRNDTFIPSLQLIPGIIPYDFLLSVHGSDVRSNSYLLDGINFTDPQSGLTAFFVNSDVIDSIEVATGGRTVQSGMTSGASINLMTRTQSKDWQGEIYSYHRTDDFSYTQTKDSFDPLINMTGLILSIGGEVAENRLWVQSTFEQQWRDFSDQVRSLEPTKDKVYTFESRATISTSQSNSLMLRYLKENQDSLSHFSPNLALWTVLESDRNKVTNDYFKTADFISANDLFRLSEIMELTLRASWLTIDSKIQPSSGNSNISSIIDPESNVILQGSFLGESRKWQSNKLQVDGGIKYYLDELAGTHNITVGFEFERDRIDTTWGFDNNIRINYRNGEPYYRQYYSGVDGAPSNINSKVSINRFSIYGQDSWQPHPRILINFGVRYNRPQVENRYARTIDWDDISPRISFNVDLWGTGKTIVRGGYSRYDKAVIASRVLPDPYGIATQFWEASVVEGGARQWSSPFDTFVHYGYGDEDWSQANLDTKPPSVNEYFISLEHQALDSLVIGMNIVAKKSKNITDDIEVIEDIEDKDWRRYSSASAIDFLGNKYVYWITHPWNDGNYSPVLLWDNDGRLYRKYVGVELYVKTRLISGFQLLGNYTWSSTRGTIDVNLEESSGFSISQNTISRFYNSEGYLSSDHRHNFNLALIFNPQANFNLGAIFTYLSGAPYNRLRYNPDVFARVYEIRSDPRGSVYRLDDVLQLDIRLEKNFPIGPSKIGFALDIFNVTNNQAVTQRIEQDTEQFGEPLKRQLPRSFQLGAKFVF